MRKSTEKPAPRQPIPKDQEPPRWLFRALASVLFLGVVLAYSNHFDNVFHFDDVHTIVENVYVRDLSHIPKYFVDASTFSTSPSNRGYRPIVTLTLALDYKIGNGLNPWAFHADQFASLLLVGFLLFFLFRSLLNVARPHPWNRYAAAIAAGVFTIHTANTETVNYLIERSDLLSTLGVVAAFLMFLEMPRARRYHLYLVPMILGILAKPPALMLAPILLLFVLMFEANLTGPELLKPSRLRAALPLMLRTIPAFVVGLAVFALASEMQRRAAGDGLLGGERPFPVWDYLITQTTSYVRYLRLFFWPVGLLADTEQKALTNVFDPRIVGSTLLLAGLGLYAWRMSLRRETRLISFGILWFVLALAPTSSLVPLSLVVCEHRTFFPYVGLALAVAVCVLNWLDGKQGETRWKQAQLTLIASLVAFAALGVGTFLRNKDWATEESLWRDITEKEPTNARAWNNYGLTFMARGDYKAASERFQQSVRLNPSYRIAFINLGITADKLGDAVQAEANFKRAIQLFEAEPDTHYFYARWLLEKGRGADAVVEATRAVQLAPQSLKIRLKMMEAYRETGDVGRLCPFVSETLALVPNDPDTMKFQNFCASGFDEQATMSAAVSTLYQKKDAAAAAAQFREILKHNPGHYGATYQLAVALDRSNQRQEARSFWEKVLPMAQGYADEKTAEAARARLKEP